MAALDEGAAGGNGGGGGALLAAPDAHRGAFDVIRRPKPRLAADFFAENWHAARGDLAASLGVVGGEVGRGQGREQQRGAVGAMAAMASGGVASWRRSVGAAGTARGVVLGLARAEWEKEERASRQREGVARERRKMTRKDEK